MSIITKTQDCILLVRVKDDVFINLNDGIVDTYNWFKENKKIDIV